MAQSCSLTHFFQTLQYETLKNSISHDRLKLLALFLVFREYTTFVQNVNLKADNNKYNINNKCQIKVKTIT